MLGEIFHIEKIMGACEKIIYFLLVDLFFWGSNLPLLLFFVFVGISQAETFLPLFLLCAIPAGPALCGVFFSMNRMLKGMEVSAWKDYWAGYKDGFLKKLGVAAIQALMVGMFWTNIRFFTVQCPVFLLTLLFILLFAVSLLTAVSAIGSLVLYIIRSTSHKADPKETTGGSENHENG